MFCCRIAVVKSHTEYRMTKTCKMSCCFVSYPLITKRFEDFLSMNTREKTFNRLLEVN